MAVDHQQVMEAMVSHVMAKIPISARKVAVAHAFLTGGVESESERPLTIGGSGTVNASVFQPFHYTALGHLHNSQQAGGQHIRYCGSLLKYSFAEAGQKKGINLVELNDQGQVSTELIRLSPRRDVRCLKGNFNEIMCGPQVGENREDYIMVTLEDNEPIIDARVRLKEVYPNVLDFDYPRLNRNGNLRGPEADHRKLTEKELFASFFGQMTGESLTDKQVAEFASVMDELYREDREVGL
jgi:exonuclease SbcD